MKIASEKIPELAACKFVSPGQVHQHKPSTMTRLPNCTYHCATTAAIFATLPSFSYPRRETLRAPGVADLCGITGLVVCPASCLRSCLPISGSTCQSVSANRYPSRRQSTPSRADWFTYLKRLAPTTSLRAGRRSSRCTELPTCPLHSLLLPRSCRSYLLPSALRPWCIFLWPRRLSLKSERKRCESNVLPGEGLRCCVKQVVVPSIFALIPGV